jgi:hypothetical protein
MKKPDILAALEPLVEVLEKMVIPYYIGGSLCSSAFGIARATLDVDLVSDLRMEHASILKEKLEKEYYVDEEMIKDAISRHSSFNIIHFETMLKIDLFVPENTSYDKEIFKRIRKDTLEEEEGAKEFYFASPEDIILKKLVWFRRGGSVSHKQWADVTGILRVQGKALDEPYLKRWASILGLSELLEKIINETNPAEEETEK